MVGDTRGPADTRRVRRLKTALALQVEAGDDGTPARMRLGGAWQDVTLLRRPWRIDQHWWRGQPVRRDYFRVAAGEGPPLTVYRDAITGEWARQEYA